LPHLPAPRKAERSDCRGYFDGVDKALRDAAKAHYTGQISESEYGLLEEELRRAQPRREPAIPKGAGKSRLALGWPRRRPRRSPDREAARARARTLGGGAYLPPVMRERYTECERAVMAVIAGQMKQLGWCDLSVAEIAARAGVCHRTVQNAVAEGVRQGHIAREEREQRGRRNLTNVLRVISREWLTWIQRGPRSIGCKEFNALENRRKKERCPQFSSSGTRVARILRVSG
jgi:hypothetical protein